MGKFIIKEKANGKRSESLKQILTEQSLKNISERITGNKIPFEVEYIPERNIGNFIIYEYEGRKNYIMILDYNKSFAGRNSFYQSITTAYQHYLGDQVQNKLFYLYDINYNENCVYKKSSIVALKLAMAIGMIPLYDSGILPYISIDEIIEYRNNNREQSKNNNPTFVEKKDNQLNIYGKVFGANAKDTELLCLAIRNLYKGEVFLYQIRDNNSKKLSKRFVEIITDDGKFFVKDDSYDFNELISNTNSTSEPNLRNPRFVFGLFELHGEKKCALCSCAVEEIIDGAHILPIEAIKLLDLSDSEKLNIATDPENGIWLCKNHHKLFDSHLIKLFRNGDFKIATTNNDANTDFIMRSIDEIKVTQFSNINNEMLDLRYNFYNNF